MKRVLIISYYFPPDNSIGSIRIRGISKYLSEYGWESIILTKNLNGSKPRDIVTLETSSCEYDVITTLKAKIGLNPHNSIKKKLDIKSTKNKQLPIDKLINLVYEVIAYPDAQKEWLEDAFYEANKFLQKEKIDAIISSSSPVTSHIIAMKLKSKYNLPWVADLRDLWTQNHYYPYSRLRKFFEKKLEINILSKADSLTTISVPLANSLKTLYKGMRVYSIINGFDPQEVSKFESSKLTKKFTITYTGVLYQGKRDPSILFESLNELISEKKVNPDEIEVRFYGPTEDWMQKDVEIFNLQRIVHEYGTISREVSLEKQRESQLLLLLLWDTPEEVGVYTGKIFEYLASQRPIISIGPSCGGVVKDLLNETGSGVYTSSVQELKRYIMQFYDEYRKIGFVSYKGENRCLQRYTQKEMAKQFATILDTIITK